MELSSRSAGTADVEFLDVYYTVKQTKNIVRAVGGHQILHSVSGSFRHGQLTAIMGSSGAGKSSLLNAISGYRKSGVTGNIKVDRKNSCYITQEDHHRTLLTVEELMNLACDLKLRKDQIVHRSQIVNDILQSLHIDHRRHTRAHKLSGGEKKRLSIALELVANPKILFLDEPTSGLDEVTASQCIQILRNLVSKGHTVICTIHQPSAIMFSYFDHVYVLGRGRCVYQGSPKALISFFNYAQHECPKHYSPADYIIELCDSDDSSENSLIQSLSDIIRNGKLIYVDASSVDQTNAQPILQSAISENFLISNNSRNACLSLLSDRILQNNVVTPKAIKNGTTATTHLDRQVTQDVSALHQFNVLLRVMMVRTMRAHIPILVQLLHHILVGICIGVIFWNLGNQGSYMFAHLKFCISTVIMIGYTQIIIPTLTYPSEVKILKKETFNNWYSLLPYYAALSLSRLPMQIIYNVLYLTITYWMTGFPSQWWRFAMFLITGLLVSFVAEGVGLSIGSTFNILNGSVVGPLSIAVFIGTGIYGFDFMQHIPKFTNVLLAGSFMRNGCKALILALFSYGREVLDCNDIYCHFSDPRVLIRFLDLQHTTFQWQIFLLILILIFFRIVFYLSLHYRCKV